MEVIWYLLWKHPHQQSIPIKFRLIRLALEGDVISEEYDLSLGCINLECYVAMVIFIKSIQRSFYYY